MPDGNGIKSVDQPEDIPAATGDDYSWCRRIQLDTCDNFPFFMKNTPIDFPFIEQQSNNEAQANKTTSDIPEFIDLNSLVIPKCFGNNENASKSGIAKIESDEKDVKEDSRLQGSKSCQILLEKERPPPRRNPPRKAQLKKPLRTSGNGFKKASSEQMAKHGNTSEVAAPTKTRSKRRKLRKDRKQDEQEERREFSTFAHHNLHLVLKYVNNLKTVNSFLGRSPQHNIPEATSLLENACMLYCIANDVEPNMLASYLTDIANEDHDDLTKV